MWLWYFCQLRVGWRNERLMKMVCLWREKSSLIDICRGTQTMQLNTRGKYLQQIRKPSMLQITDSKTVLVFFLHLRKRGGAPKFFILLPELFRPKSTYWNKSYPIRTMEQEQNSSGGTEWSAMRGLGPLAGTL